MGWETRIFFDLSGEQRDNAKQHLTLRNAAVADCIVQGVQINGCGGSEQRRDDYVVLTKACPGATKIGIKARSVRQEDDDLVLELKTVVPSKDDDNDDELACWIKSSQYYSKGNVSDKSLLLQFLSEQTEKHHLASMARDYLQDYPNNSVPILRAHKERRRAWLDGLDVEETDIVFRLVHDNDVARGNSGNENGAVPSDCCGPILLRSWAVEGSNQNESLATIATTWHERFDRALSVANIDKASPPRMWIASYPAMVVHLSEMMMTKMT